MTHKPPLPPLSEGPSEQGCRHATDTNAALPPLWGLGRRRIRFRPARLPEFLLGVLLPFDNLELLHIERLGFDGFPLVELLRLDKDPDASIEPLRHADDY